MQSESLFKGIQDLKICIQGHRLVDLKT